MRRLRQDELLIVSGNRKPAVAGALREAQAMPSALPVAALAPPPTRRAWESLRERVGRLNTEDSALEFSH